MPAINFKKQFADMVDRGEKTQTIRQIWSNPIKAGDTLYLYTGMRTKSCRKLGEVLCRKVSPITVNPANIQIDGQLYGYLTTKVTNLALADGFFSGAAMGQFFKELYGLPFDGVLIEWDE